MAAELRRGMQPHHIQMVEWVMQNPGGTLREMSAYFGYSIPWLSQVCNSDFFRAAVADRLKDVQAVVTMDIPQRMRALAELAIEKQTEVLQKTEDAELITESFDKIMHRYGYAPNARNGAQSGPSIGQQNNIFYLNKEQFKEVQGQLVAAHAERLPAPKPEQEDDAAAAPAISEKV